MNKRKIPYLEMHVVRCNVWVEPVLYGRRRNRDIPMVRVRDRVKDRVRVRARGAAPAQTGLGVLENRLSLGSHIPVRSRNTRFPWGS